MKCSLVMTLMSLPLRAATVTITFERGAPDYACDAVADARRGLAYQQGRVALLLSWVMMPNAAAAAPTDAVEKTSRVV